MDWKLPDSSTLDTFQVKNIPEYAEEVVFVVWTAAELHYRDGKVELGILLLDKLLSSPYGTASQKLELKTRIRLAEWCATKDSLLDVATYQLKRALLLSSDLSEEEVFYVYEELVKIAWRQFELGKTQKEAERLSRTITCALQASTSSTHRNIQWTIHYSLHSINLSRITRNTSRVDSELMNLWKKVDHWAHLDSVVEKVGRSYITNLKVFLHLFKILTSLERMEGEANLKTWTLDSFNASFEDSSPQLLHMQNHIKVVTLIHQQNFLEASRLVTEDDINMSPLFEACLRYTSQFSASNKKTSLVTDVSLCNFRELASLLTRDEATFVSNLQGLKLSSCAVSLKKFRSLLVQSGDYMQNTLFRRYVDRFKAMRAIYQFVCYSDTQGFYDLTSQLTYATDCEYLSFYMNSGSNVEMNGGEVTLDDGAAETLARLIKCFINRTKMEETEIIEIEKRNRKLWGMLCIELWTRILRLDRCHTSIGLAQKVGFTNLEYVAIKSVLKYDSSYAKEVVKMTGDQLMGRMNFILRFFHEEVVKAIEEIKS